jgi:guanine deaminase
MGEVAPKSTNRAILAHCVHLTEEERGILKKYDGGISHCGNSNISIMSGLMPTKELMNEGIKTSLGTDVSGGCSVSMLDSMRVAMNISKILSL